MGVPRRFFLFNVFSLTANRFAFLATFIACFYCTFLVHNSTSAVCRGRSTAPIIAVNGGGVTACGTSLLSSLDVRLTLVRELDGGLVCVLLCCCLYLLAAGDRRVDRDLLFLGEELVAYARRLLAVMSAFS